MKYYKNEDDINEGVLELGKLVLAGAKILPSEDVNKNIIRVSASSTEKDIRLESPSKALYERWLSAIQEHIQYADANEDVIFGTYDDSFKFY